MSRFEGACGRTASRTMARRDLSDMALGSAQAGRFPACCLVACALAVAVTFARRAIAAEEPPSCPVAGAALSLSFPRDAATADTVFVAGELLAPRCSPPAGARLSVRYAEAVFCPAGAQGACRLQLFGLHPGEWLHQAISVRPAGIQMQGHRRPLLALDAGVNRLEWPLYASVQMVTSLGDEPGCTGCLRAALSAAESAPAPALVQFQPGLRGTIELLAPLPPLATDNLTIDGHDLDGSSLVRTVDAGGMDAPVLAINGSFNRVRGLRLTGSGGNSDLLVVAGPEANGNVLENLELVGRAETTCGDAAEGCVVAGVCQLPETHGRNAGCGDDVVAVREGAGSVVPNMLLRSRIRGAYDKGIKVSEQAVAVIDACEISANRDGGVQATLGGQIRIHSSRIFDNAGTASASGLAANGAASSSGAPARIVTRGNLIYENGLRGVSVRRRSQAELDSDWVCGNGTTNPANGFGLTVVQVSAQPVSASAGGLALVGNAAGGALVTGTAELDLSLGGNVFAGNGPGADPSNLVQSSGRTVPAAGNHWEACGRAWRCDENAVRRFDVGDLTGAGVNISPARPSFQRQPPRIDRVEPPDPTPGQIVRLFGSGFDALSGNAGVPPCSRVSQANSCRPLRGNCVQVDGTPARVVAVTPRMLAFEMPVPCIVPTLVSVRTRFSRGVGRAGICVLPEEGESGPGVGAGSFTTKGQDS